MKKLFPLFALIAVVFTTSKAFSQNNFWTFPEQYWQPVGLSTGILPTSPSGYHGDPSNSVHAGIQDPYGNIIFYTVDGRIYNKNGVENSFPM